MKGFITMIRDISDVVIDVSHATIINTSNIAIVAAAYAQDSWKSLAPPLPLLEPSANDISGILLGKTIIQGNDLSGITIGDHCTASGEYAVAMGWGADASGTEGFVYRDICGNVFAFDSGPPPVLRVNHQDPDAAGGTGGDLSQNMLSDFDASGTIETSGVILAPIHSAEGSTQSVVTDLDASTNPLMTKGMLWINEARDASSGWSTIVPLSGAPSYHAADVHTSACVLGGKLYVSAAVIEYNAVLVYEYNPISNTWRVLPHFSPRLYPLFSTETPSLTTLGGKLYAIGGVRWDQHHSQITGTPSFSYDPSTNMWSTIADMQRLRYNAGVAALGGKIYACAGVSAEDAVLASPPPAGAAPILNSAEVYDPIDNSWNFIASMVDERNELRGGVTALVGKLYAVGSNHDPPNAINSRATAEVYDPTTNVWTLISSPIEPAFPTSVAAVAGRLFLVEQRLFDGQTTQSTISGEVYDPVTDTWTIFDTAMNAARSFGSAVGWNGELWVVGGWVASPGGGTFGDIEVYDPSLVQMPQITYQGEDFYLSHARGGPKTFIIPHPEHEGKMLRHACLEAPTRGTNVYEYQITTTEDNQTTEAALPSYFKHINGRARVYVSVVEQNEWGKCRGFVNDDLTKALVETEKSGTYNVMVTGVRKDPEAVAYSATENIDDPIDEKDI